MRGTFALASLVRGILLLYGYVQDSYMNVKYSDVDYEVFGDAAALVRRGISPYERHTYRYTPFLAFMLLPNTYLPSFGKILFSVCDIVVGILIGKILIGQGIGYRMRKRCISLWLFNPLTLTVSTRGNAESILGLLLLAAIYFLQEKKILLAGFLYGTAIHFKFYPIIYFPSFWLYIDQKVRRQKNAFLTKIWPTQARALFAFTALFSTVAFTVFSYYCYGSEFLRETLFYHVLRKDTRHNFSPYFYMFYLEGDSQLLAVKLMNFVPQAALLLQVAYRYYYSVSLCSFLQTFLFVSFNKVCTSQYFLWYLWLLPLIIPTLDIRLATGLLMALCWLAAQGAWLAPAYFLEFQGWNSFVFIWLGSLVFLVANTVIAVTIVKCQKDIIRQSKGD